VSSTRFNPVLHVHVHPPRASRARPRVPPSGPQVSGTDTASIRLQLRYPKPIYRHRGAAPRGIRPRPQRHGENKQAAPRTRRRRRPTCRSPPASARRSPRRPRRAASGSPSLLRPSRRRCREGPAGGEPSGSLLRPRRPSMNSTRGEGLYMDPPR
jgi:hypothetical protein